MTQLADLVDKLAERLAAQGYRPSPVAGAEKTLSAAELIRLVGAIERDREAVVKAGLSVA